MQQSADNKTRRRTFNERDGGNEGDDGQDERDTETRDRSRVDVLPKFSRTKNQLVKEGYILFPSRNTTSERCCMDVKTTSKCENRTSF